MDKLKLDLEELTVESFEADGEDDSRGTVRGNDRPTNSEPSICRTCDGDRTCYTINCC